MTTRGRFVVLEGGDATGKSTQVARLAARLRDEGHEVVETFEPGATALGAALRALLLDVRSEVDPLAEALLMAADRAQHVATVVAPALDRGAWVVSDRYLPSSLAYQGIGRGLGVDAVEALNAPAIATAEPDLVVVLDLTTDVARARRPGEERDRMEGAGDDFAASVFRAYRDLASSRGWAVVDAGGSPDEVADAIWSIVREGCAP